MQSETFSCCERIGNLLNLRAPALSSQKLNELSENSFLTCICGNLSIDVYSKDVKNLFSLFEGAEEPVAKKPRFYESPPASDVGDLMQSDQPPDGDWVRFISTPISDQINKTRVVKFDLMTKSEFFGETPLAQIVKKFNEKAKKKFKDDFVNPPIFLDWAQRMTRYETDAASIEDYAENLGFANMQKYPNLSFDKSINSYIIPDNFIESVPNVNEKIKFRLWVMPGATIEFVAPFDVLKALGFIGKGGEGLKKAPDGSLLYVMKNPYKKYEVDNAEHAFSPKKINIQKATYLKSIVKIDEHFEVTEEYANVGEKSTVADSFDFIQTAVASLAKKSNRIFQVLKARDSNDITFDFPKLSSMDYALEFSPSLTQKLGLSASVLRRGAPNASISVVMNPNQIYKSTPQQENVAGLESHHSFLAKQFDLIVAGANSRRQTCANLKTKLATSNDVLAQIAMSISKLSTVQKNRLSALESQGQALARLNKKFLNEVDNAEYEIGQVRDIRDNQENVTLESNEKLKLAIENAQSNLSKLINNLDIVGLDSNVSTFESDVGQFEDSIDTSEQKKLGKAIINTLREKASQSSQYYLNNKATLNRALEISDQLADITSPTETETKMKEISSSIISKFRSADFKIANAQTLIADANGQISDVFSNASLSDDEIITELNAIRDEKTSPVDAKLQESKTLIDDSILALTMLENAWLSYNIEKAIEDITGKLSFISVKYKNYNENAINGLGILKTISGDASLAAELSQLTSDLSGQSSNQVRYETLAKEYKEELQNVDRLRATPTAAHKKVEKLQQAVNKLLDDLNNSATTASDLLNKCKSLKIRSDVIETKKKIAVVHGLEQTVQSKMDVMPAWFDDLNEILESINGNSAMSTNTRLRYSSWKRSIASLRKEYSSNLTKLGEIKASSKSLAENIRTVPPDTQTSSLYYNTGVGLETSITKLNNWALEHEPDVFFVGLETEGNAISEMISSEEQDRNAAKALLNTKQGSIVNDLEGIKTQLEGLTNHLLDPTTIVPPPNADQLSDFQTFCVEQGDSIQQLMTDIQNLEQRILESEQDLTQEVLAAWEGEKNELKGRIPTLETVDETLKASFATFQETALQQQATIDSLKAEARDLLKWFDDQGKDFSATEQNIVDEIARIDNLLINGKDVENWETRGKAAIAKLNTLMQSQRTREEMSMDAKSRAEQIESKTDIDEIQRAIEGLNTTKVILQTYVKGSAEKLKKIKDSLSTWEIDQPPIQVFPEKGKSQTIYNLSRSELAKRDSLGFARKIRDSFQNLTNVAKLEEFAWEPIPAFKPQNYTTKDFSAKEYRESGFDEPISPEPEIEIPIPPREPEISTNVPVLGWKGLPTSYSEMVCQYVNSIGNVYACLENYAGGSESNFPGKLFFVLIPDGTKWKLLDNSSAMVEPFNISGADFRKVTCTNPMQIRLYHHDKEGKLVVLGDDIPKRFEGLFHFCFIDVNKMI